MERKLFTAGEIAKLAGVSVRTIRFYDVKGILKPVDYSETGYRYYDTKSMERLQKILMLKFIGFSLVQIEEIVKKEEEEGVIVNLKDSFSMQKSLLKEKREHLDILIDALEEAEQVREDEIWDKMVNIIQITTKKEKIAKQYRTDENLQKRINLHAYSTAKVSWMQWVYNRLKIKSGMKILEIGCGNGLLWTSVLKQLPDNLTIYLTDYSDGMLSKAKEAVEPYQKYALEKNIQFRFEQKDANDFEVEETGFDLIIANHMLYHVNEKQQLFQKISKLLKKDGTFCCTTVGDTHMLELHNLVEDFNKEIEIPYNWITGSFRLENGRVQLQKVFPKVIMEEQENDLIVDDVNAIYDYVYSYPGNAKTILDKCGEMFQKNISDKISQEGAMFIHKSSGIFLCTFQ